MDIDKIKLLAATVRETEQAYNAADDALAEAIDWDSLKTMPESELKAFLFLIPSGMTRFRVVERIQDRRFGKEASQWA